MSDALPDPALVAWRRAILGCPPAMSRWRHRERGTVYLVLGPTLLENGLVPAVRYRPADDPDGPQWVRPLTDFLDGRFAGEDAG